MHSIPSCRRQDQAIQPCSETRRELPLPSAARPKCSSFRYTHSGRTVPLAGKELEAFLQEAHLAHFATSGPDGRPRVRPIWFCYADGAFWFTTRLEDRPYRAVIAYGRPEVSKKDTRRWLQRIATRYGEVEGKRWLAGALKEPDRVVLRLVPEKAVAWHYGKGDYTRMQKKESLR